MTANKYYPYLNPSLLFFFILLKFLLQYAAINPAYELHRDEYLHLDQANHLDWGFISVPPITSILALLIKWLGNDIFWVKFFPAVTGALVILIVWKLVEKLGGGSYARVLAATALLFSALTRLNTLLQPNSLDVLCWTLSLYFVIRFIQTAQNKWLLWLGIAFGIGFLNKYNIVFLILGLIPAVLLTEHRKVILNKYFYVALLIALLIVSPNLYWQYTHDFPVAHHMQHLAATQLIHVDRTDFIKEQFLFFIGTFYLIIFALYALACREPYRKYRVIFWSYIFTMLLFLYFRAKGYYAIGLYPPLVAFGSVYTEHLFSKSRLKKIRWVLPLLAVGIFIPIARIAFPVLKPETIQQEAAAFQALGLLRWEDGRDHDLPQDFADMLGWRELAQKVDQQYAAIREKSNTLVLCDNYGQAGAINYYSAYPHIRAVSFNADYINWFPLENKIKHIILVKEANHEDIDRQYELTLFESVKLSDSLTNPFARERGTRIYLLRNAKADINALLVNDIKEYKTKKIQE